jgi:DNA (cytosine-5)-methyltransferase 1
MNRRIELLDLCCGAGGCSMGYYQAAQKLGLDIQITGIDKKKQKNYPFTFHQGDALAYLVEHGKNFTHVHASPPCQAYSNGSAPARKEGKKYDSGIFHDIRVEMYNRRIPGVIENVPGSPTIPDVVLNGLMFGLPVKRTRWFELVHWFMLKPSVPMHRKGAYLRGEIISIFGNGQMKSKNGAEIQVPGSTVGEKRGNAMQIDWMSKMELAQAIPPAYTKYIGENFLKVKL